MRLQQKLQHTLSLLFFIMAFLLPHHVMAQVETINDAIKKGDLELVKHFIEEDNAHYNLTVTDSHGYTALHDAVDYKQFEIAKYLLSKKANVNAKAKNDVTALFIATQHNLPKYSSLLIKAGADINAQSAKGITSLMFAAEHDYIEIVKTLLKAKADPNIHSDFNGATALSLASLYGRTEIVKLLLKAKADPNKQSHEDGSTPLFLASFSGQTEVVKLLLKANANPRIEAKNGYNSVQVAEYYQQQNPDNTQWAETIALLKEKEKTAPTPPPPARKSRGSDQAGQFLDQADAVQDKLVHAMSIYADKLKKHGGLSDEKQLEFLQKFIADLGNGTVDPDEFIKTNGENYAIPAE